MSATSLSVAHSAAPNPRSAEHRVACFAVQALADPGLLSRVLELFAKRGLVPERWIAQREARAGDGDTLSIDIQVVGFTPELTDYVARCLRQIPQVTAVLTSEKITA